MLTRSYVEKKFDFNNLAELYWARIGGSVRKIVISRSTNYK